MGRWLKTGVLASAAIMLFVMPVHAKESLIPEGIYVGERSLSGMTQEKAEEFLKAEIQQLLEADVCLKLDDALISVPANCLGVQWSNPDVLDETMKKLDGNLIQQYMKREDLKRNPLDLKLQLNVEEAVFQKFVSEQCAEYLSEAVNACITRKDDKFEIVPGRVGRCVDIPQTKAVIEECFSKATVGAKRRNKKLILQAVLQDVQPDISSDMLASIHDTLGTYSTDFRSSSASRAGNLKNGSLKINGTLLMPGETLSGYECMHPFTTENGYFTAAAYENGQVVDSVGGGVCQIATTLYNAALRAELEITQRQNHSMVVGYVEPSMDAAIAGTYKDIKITNNYSTPIYIEGGTEGTCLYFTIYGKETRPANRCVSFVSETISTTNPGGPTQKLDRSLAPGTRRQVQAAHIGKKSRLWKIVTIDGKETERRVLHEDVYNPAKAIILVGPEVKPETKDFQSNVMQQELPETDNAETDNPETEAGTSMYGLSDDAEVVDVKQTPEA